MYVVELANKIRGSRCVGNLYLVIQKFPQGGQRTIAECDTSEDAHKLKDGFNRMAEHVQTTLGRA